MARPHKLTEEHLDEINGYIVEGMSNNDIADKMNVDKQTIARYRSRHEGKISSYKLPKIEMTKEDVKEMNSLIHAYKKIFIRRYKDNGFYPDNDEIESMLYWDYIQARVKYKQDDAKFSTFLIERFWWSYKAYLVKLINEPEAL